MNSIEKSISNINFFRNNDIKIQKNDLGHSGAFVYYVIMNNKEYFLKIIKHSEINRIKDVYNSYLASNINTPKLIECGEIDNDFSYFIYESIGRTTLKSKMEKMTLEAIYNIGVFIGKENRRLSNNHKNKFDQKELTIKFADSIITYYLGFIKLLEENKKEFTNDELSILSNMKLKDLLNNLLKLIKSEKVVYCHNDIKTNNIMFKDNKLYFVDIENTNENFFYRTLGANIFTIIPKTDIKYAQFYNGVLAGFYNFDIPAEIKDYLILNYLSQMLQRINSSLTKKNDIKKFISDTKEFSQLLKQSDYFNKYDFSFLKINKKYELLDIEIRRISAELSNKYNYKLVNKIDGGYSGAISLLIMKSGKKYFCKIYNYKVDFNYIRNCLDIYKKLNINSLEFLDYGTLFGDQYCFVVYNYIEGICLNNYINKRNLNKNKIINYGIKVGNVAKNLKDYKYYDEKDFSIISIINETKSIVDGVKSLLNDQNKKSMINNYIKINRLDQLISDFVKYMDAFKEEKTNLIHQDLKPANIMISNDQIYIIDVESMILSYNVFDFKCTITWDLVQSYENEINYLKGYFNGLYDFKIPKTLNEQLKYIFLYDFFRSLIGLLDDNNIDIIKVKNYINGVLNLINKDLDSIFDFVTN